MNIAYVTSLFPHWSETFIHNEILALEKKGLEITVFSLRTDVKALIHAKSNALIAKTVYAKKRCILLGWFYWIFRRPLTVMSLIWLILKQKYAKKDMRLKNMWSMAAGLYFAKVCREQGISHVHAHFATYPALIGMVISEMAGIGFSFTAHAHDIFLDRTLLAKKVMKASFVAAISEYNKRSLVEHCKGSSSDKIHVVHCGIDLEEHPLRGGREESPEPVVLFIGRLIRMKGVDHLVSACAGIVKEVKFRCFIVGEGYLRSQLEQKIKDSGLEGMVSLKGALEADSVKLLLRQATLLALPSIWDDKDGQDGIPVALMEAMAMGVPVVSTRISGIPELVENEISGKLVEPGDVAALAKAIIALLRAPEERKRLSANARKKIESDFDITQSAAKLYELFCKRCADGQ